MLEELPWDVIRDSMSAYAHDSVGRFHNTASVLTAAKHTSPAAKAELDELQAQAIKIGKGIGQVHFDYGEFRRSTDRPLDFEAKMAEYRRRIQETSEGVPSLIERLNALRREKAGQLTPEATKHIDSALDELEMFRRQFPPEQLGTKIKVRMGKHDFDAFMKRFLAQDFVDRDGNPVTVVRRGKRIGELSFDTDLTSRALYNLVTDAYNHTPGRPLYVTYGRKDGHVYTNVTNEGPKLNPAELAKIGRERFTRAWHDPKRGYGKISARLLMEAQGGTFRARNSGIGPMLSLSLPHAKPHRRA